MEAILGIIGFLVCFFVFHICWWRSLLIAFIGIPLLWDFVIGPLFVGGAYGVAWLLDKIKERRRSPYPETDWKNAYEVAARQEELEVPLAVKAESFIMYMMDKGLHTRAEMKEQGKIFGYSEATIGRALNNLMEAGEIERIARGIYSKVSTVPGEKLMPEEVTQPQIGDAEEIAAMMLEIERQRKKQSNTFGIWSLVLGIVGILTFFVPVLAIVAIVLGALQFRRHRTKCSIAGLILGIISVVLFVILIKWLSYEVPYYPTTV